jgi:hypothetical protein
MCHRWCSRSQAAHPKAGQVRHVPRDTRARMHKHDGAAPSPTYRSWLCWRWCTSPCMCPAGLQVLAPHPYWHACKHMTWQHCRQVSSHVDAIAGALVANSMSPGRSGARQSHKYALCPSQALPDSTANAVLHATPCSGSKKPLCPRDLTPNPDLIRPCTSQRQGPECTRHRAAAAAQPAQLAATPAGMPVLLRLSFHGCLAVHLMRFRGLAWSRTGR